MVSEMAKLCGESEEEVLLKYILIKKKLKKKIEWEKVATKHT